MKIKPILVCRILAIVLVILFSFIAISTIIVRKKEKACKKYSEEYGNIWSNKRGTYVANSYWSGGKHYVWNEEDGAYIISEDFSSIDDNYYGCEPSVDEVIEMQKEEIKRIRQVRSIVSYISVFLAVVFAVFLLIGKNWE